MTSTTKPVIQNRDLLALRSFVTGKDHGPPSKYEQQHLIIVDITHSNLQQRHIEARFHLSDTLQDLRRHVYQTTGTPDADQILQLLDESNCMTTQLTPDVPDSTPLASLLLQRGMTVHCIDTNPFSLSRGGALEDTRLCKKFELTDEQYNARKNTLRKWANEQKQQNPNFTLENHATEHLLLQKAKFCQKRGLALPEGVEVDENGELKVAATVNTNQSNDSNTSAIANTNTAEELFDEASVQHVTVGQRCEVTPGGRRGKIAWVGQFEKSKQLKKASMGWWIGIELDEPLGNNDGTFEGMRYFTPFNGTDRHGCFARGPNVDVGDFPERELWDSDDEDEL